MWWLVAGVAVLAIASAAGLSLALTGGRATAATAEARGYRASQVFRHSHSAKGSGGARSLAEDPLSTLLDNLKEDCYEWQGDNLYNLCFKDGVLHLKTIF